MIGSFAASFTRSLSAYQQSSTALQKKRLRGLLIAFGVGYLDAVVFLPTVGLPVYPFGYLPIRFFIVMSAYVTVRYKFTDITRELATDPRSGLLDPGSDDFSTLNNTSIYKLYSLTPTH